MWQVVTYCRDCDEYDEYEFETEAAANDYADGVLSPFEVVSIGPIGE